MEIEVAELLKHSDTNKRGAEELNKMSKDELDAESARLQNNIKARQEIMADWARQDKDQLDAVNKAVLQRQQNEQVMVLRGGLPQES